MEIAGTISEIREKVSEWKKSQKTIGLVPTMGCLHNGHGSLIKRAVSENDIVIVSNFVNPTQFAPTEDFENYPRNFEADCKFCEELGVDLVFHPKAEEMYDKPYAFVDIELLSKGLCGKSRPTHFKGVLTVVSKLFNISKADRAYFGKKDAQQLFVIKKMVKDLNFDIDIIGCPIVRESDGLAISSRNTYLDVEERKAALCLSKAVKAGEALVKKGISSKELILAMKDVIEKEPKAKIDYIEAVDLETLQPLEKIDDSVLVAMAVYIGKTRLLDNFIYES